MDLSLQIDKVNAITPSDFRKNYFRPHKPVVIRGLAENTEAGQKWSIDYFRQTMGHHSVDVYDNRNIRSSASAITRPDLQMKFGEYLDAISSPEHSNLRIFLFNMFRLNPGLKKEFPCPEIFAGTLDKIGHMFFGGKGTTVRVHYDIDMSNVLHTQFGGRKRVVLLAPEYSDLLYRLPLNTYSLVDVHKPDYKNFPALQLVKGYDFILEPGDSLFMPSGYWHHMTYLEEGFSISYRKMATSLSARAQGLKYLLVSLPLDKLANKLLGESWLETKKRVAARRAYRAIERAYRQAQPAFFADSQDITFV
jgi:hypothetical protein